MLNASVQFPKGIVPRARLGEFSSALLQFRQVWGWHHKECRSP
jgi:hypothetical protein